VAATVSLLQNSLALSRTPTLTRFSGDFSKASKSKSKSRSASAKCYDLDYRTGKRAGIFAAREAK
jgi:hypothetical protein